MSQSTKLEKYTSIDPDQLENGQVFTIRHFTLKYDGLYITSIDKNTKKETIHKISEPMFVKQTVQNLDTKDVGIHLCYKFNDKFHTIEIGMGQLVPNELLKLSAKGVDVSYENMKAIASYLRKQQKVAPHQEIYREVGWHQNSERHLLFRHHHIISNSTTLSATNDVEGGTYNLEPAGTLDAWKEMFVKEVANNLMLQFLLCTGFSAAIVGYLSKFYDDVDTLLIHLAGNSTQGKTTGALLFASIFGLPSNRNKGLQRTWNGTTNAMINMMGGNYGIPVVLDELSMSNANSLTSEIYVLTSGQEKYRLTEDIEQRKPKTWGSTILSTGEKSIFEMTNNNAGLMVRVFEFANISWTTSADNADAIRRVIQDNYGHAGAVFVAYLFEKGLNIIDDTWEKWQNICEEALPNTPFRTRVAKKYAILLAAGDLANQALQLSLNLEGILSFLVEDEKEKMVSRDIGEKARSYITQLVAQHQMNFKRENYNSNPINCWGKIFVRPPNIEIAFLKNVLEHQLRIGGFDDPRVIVREWKEKGWLVTEGDRSTKRTRIFEATEKADRKKALGRSSVPKKLEDTTYNIKLPLDSLEELLHQQHPMLLDE